MYDSSQLGDVNLLAEFLAATELTTLQTTDNIDAIVICASEVLVQAEVLFSRLSEEPKITSNLVLCGGLGHSTERLYQAVARHPKFKTIADEVRGLAEARVLEKILRHFYEYAKIISAGCAILIEDQSTNCGLNAHFSRAILDDAGRVQLKRIVVVQDPTMALRTVASFNKAYLDQSSPPILLSYPIFTPKMISVGDRVEVVTGFPGDHIIWDIDRFTELIMGEIPRLRDDEAGYGPKGKNFIVHVDVPVEVELSWQRLRTSVQALR